MKNLKINLKKTNKYYRFSFYTIFILFLISSILVFKSILLLNGIETLFRVLIIIIISVILLLYFISNLVFLILKKHKIIVLTGIIAIIMILINSVAFYFISKTYNILDDLNKDKIIYTTNLIALNETNNFKTIGMISNEDDIEGNVLPKEYIKKNKKDYKIKYFDSYDDLINNLYEKNIDGVFITSNYIIIYKEDYEDIETTTKVVDSYSKKMKNQDTIIGTGKKITEPFTVLLVGVDSKYEGLDQNSPSNGDALMLISFNPKTLNLIMFSIPRDTFVPIACNNNKRNKINSSAAYGTKCIIDTIENFTNIGVDYYVKMNFKGVVDLVDALGGIEVVVPKSDIKKGTYCTQNSDRELDTICLTPGLQTLNGEEALGLSRVRKEFLTSDFKRNQNQQLVTSGIFNKAKSLRNINDIYNVLNVVSKNLDTNIQTKEILNFYNVLKTMFLNPGDEFLSIEKTYLNVYTMTVNNYGSIVLHYKESLDEITKAIKVNLEIDKPELIKTFNFSVNEIYQQKTIGKEAYGNKDEETLPNFVGETYSYLENWNITRNISINKIEEENNSCTNGTIIKQSITKDELISEITSLTVTICKNEKEEEIITIPITTVPVTTEPTTTIPIINEEDDQV